MKSAIVFCLAFAVMVLARPEEKYTDKYDNVDLDEILTNERLFETYYKCVMDQGKCTPDGKELRDHVQDALETECTKCTEAQKSGTNKVLKHLINNKPMYWDELTAKFDAEKKYAAKYEKEFKELKA